MGLRVLTLLACAAALAHARPTPRSSVNDTVQNTASPPPAPSVGAIRWDCWYNTSWNWPDPGFAIEAALGRAEWRSRVPWFCEELGANNITCNNNVQSVVDAEIEMAVQAGLSFWAFDTYAPDSPLTIPKELYWGSATPAKANLSWAHVLQTPNIAGRGLEWFTTQYVPTLVHDFGRLDYLLCLGGRPVVFLFDVYEAAFQGGGRTGWEGWTEALSFLANATVQAGLGAPYVSAMVWSAGEGAALVKGINPPPPSPPLVQSLTSYAYTEGAAFPTPGLYSGMAGASPGYWSSLAGTGADVIPPVSAGWDPRPMNGSALPWQNYTNPAFLTMPTPAELASLVQAALDWSAANPAANPTGLHLLSAWNEHAEGHYVAPVLPAYGGGERLDAIRRVLRPGGDDSFPAPLPPSSPPPPRLAA